MTAGRPATALTGYAQRFGVNVRRVGRQSPLRLQLCRDDEARRLLLGIAERHSEMVPALKRSTRLPYTAGHQYLLIRAAEILERMTGDICTCYGDGQITRLDPSGKVVD